MSMLVVGAVAEGWSRKPVMSVYTREDDVRGLSYRPFVMSRVRAGVAGPRRSPALGRRFGRRASNGASFRQSLSKYRLRKRRHSV